MIQKEKAYPAEGRRYTYIHVATYGCLTIDTNEVYNVANANGKYGNVYELNRKTEENDMEKQGGKEMR